MEKNKKPDEVKRPATTKETATLCITTSTENNNHYEPDLIEYIYCEIGQQIKTNKEPYWIRGRIENINTFNFLRLAKSTPNSFRSVYAYPTEIDTYASKNKTPTGQPSLKGWPGKYIPAFFGWDLDLDKGKARSHLDDVRKTVLRNKKYLELEFDISSEYIQVFYSGGRGYHLVLPTQIVTEDLIPREGCCKVVRWFQMNVFPDNEYLDFSVTDELSLFRLPNTLHTSGECYKIYLTDAELENLTAEEHQELAKTPKEVPLLELEQIVPAVALERIWKKALRQDFPLLAKEKRRAKAKLKAKAKATGEKFSTVIKNDNNNNNGADEVDLHIAFLDGVPKGIRHNILVRLVGYYRTMRIAMEQVERMMLDWNLRCSPPREGREFLKELEQLLDDSQYINDDMYSENRIIATVEKGATPPTTILFLDGHELLFSKSVNTLQGTYGANKSFFASHIVAAILNPYKEQMFLGIEVNTSMEYSVLYVDTERTVADEYPYNVRSMLCLAGLNPKRMPPNFRALSFSTVQRQFRLDEIERILEGERKKDKHSLIVFDVISDLTSNFNDLHQCNRLLDKMNVLIEDNDITILGLIHVNYGTQKARGHVGSELVNKSKTAMGIGYAGGNDGKRKIIELEMIKTRFVKPRDKFYMKRIGRDEYQELVFADASEIAGIEQKKAPIDDIIKYLVDKNITEITRPELAARLRKSFGASKTTIVERLEMLEDKPYLFTAYKKVLEVSHGTRNTHIYRISEITDD